MLTQIYEVNTPAEAQAISAIGVNHVGVKVGSGEFAREISVIMAMRIAAAVPPPSKFVALFLSSDASFIAECARELRPAIVHLGASPDALPPKDVAILKEALSDSLIMRTIPVFGQESVTIADSYAKIADFLLLDSYRPSDGKIGALGVVHDWEISRRIVAEVGIPVILAGGLGPENVADAIRSVRPAGVDSKTKTDRPGSHRKDLDRVRLFHHAASAAR
jgi:phosphoribosylanthranilate isomerase